MAPQKRQAILIGVMLALLAAAAAWNVLWMREQRARARVASVDLAECRRLGRAITALRDAARVAPTEALGVQALGDRIEAASRQARLVGPALAGVFPQSARRVGDSPYMQKPTALALRGVTLQQAATFLFHLSEDSGLSVRDLRLQAPHGEEGTGAWDVDATVTYLLYAPPTAAERGN